jgi:hypothetical protein
MLAGDPSLCQPRVTVCMRSVELFMCLEGGSGLCVCGDGGGYGVG